MRLTVRDKDGLVRSAIDCPHGCQYVSCSLVDGMTCQHQCEADVMCKLADYEDIGTVEELRELKEKATAKKPRFYAHDYYCIECGNLVGNNEFEWQRFEYCDKCGQKLDWSEGKE